MSYSLKKKNILYIPILGQANMGLVTRKPVLWFANNTGTDQPAHPRSLISAFVICFLESITSKFGTSEISIF